jgi:hypothetical protein
VLQNLAGWNSRQPIGSMCLRARRIQSSFPLRSPPDLEPTV